MSPLPLSKLPSSCGYTISSTRRDLVLVAPYDGCFVALQVGHCDLKALHILTTCLCIIASLLLSGGHLCSPTALVGHTSEDVMPFHGLAVTESSDGHLQYCGHARKNRVDPARLQY